MKKKTVKKLVLSKETVRKLEKQGDLKDVAGGMPPVTDSSCCQLSDCSYRPC